ncbi:MAG: hypothetical protein JWO02_2775 [Solirubrobacterales bacterium]|nr:hypothetical protein [Solirubrobacterales bacterium]
MHNRVLSLIVVGLVCLTGTAQASAAGTTVTVRVEGQAATLLEETTVTLDGTPTPAPGNCAGNTAAAALEKATHGNWDRQAFASTILGENHSFANNDYWGEWVSDKYGGGICNDVVQEGDRLVMLVDISGTSFEPTVYPLTMTGVPAKVSPGTPFTVDVTKHVSATGTPGEGTPTAAAGAQITGAGVTTTGDGKATITLSQRGETTLKAVLAGSQSGAAPKVSSRSAAAKVCVTDGADGFCGTTKPGEPAPVVPQAPACRTTGKDGLCGSPDRTAPTVAVTGLKEQAHFLRGHAPRTLAGKVDADPAGLKDVRLRLTRTLGPRCSYYSGTVERFVKTTVCGATGRRFFSIGDRADWSYLLPFDLPRGRYVLDVQVVDKAGNVSAISARGRDRIVFVVT